MGKKGVILLFFIGHLLVAEAQFGINRVNPSYTSWKVSLSYNFIENDNQPLQILALTDSWNALAYPSKINIEKGLNKYFSVHVSGSFNKYRVGKIVEDYPVVNEYYYLSGDLNGKFNLLSVWGFYRWFDPFLLSGISWDLNKGKINTGFGFNVWGNKRLGLTLEAIGKWGMTKEKDKLIQYSAGVTYRFLERQTGRSLRYIRRLSKVKF